MIEWLLYKESDNITLLEMRRVLEGKEEMYKIVESKTNLFQNS